MSESESPNDTVDVSNAEEERVREIVRDELSVQGEDGERWSIYDLMDIGLTRRQALYAIGLIGAGYSVTQAAVSAMSETAEAAQGTGNLGTESNPLDTVYANNLGSSTEPVQSATVQSLDAGSATISNQISAGSVDTSELSITDGRGLLGLPNHHVNYASSLADEEIARFTLKSGDVLELWRLEVQLKGGGTNSNVSLDVYDATNATVLGSVTAGSRSEGGSTPLGTSGAGATIIVRLSTGSNSVDICATGLTSVVTA